MPIFCCQRGNCCTNKRNIIILEISPINLNSGAVVCHPPILKATLEAFCVPVVTVVPVLAFIRKEWVLPLEFKLLFLKDQLLIEVIFSVILDTPIPDASKIVEYCKTLLSEAKTKCRFSVAKEVTVVQIKEILLKTLVGKELRLKIIKKSKVVRLGRLAVKKKLNNSYFLNPCLILLTITFIILI